MFRCNSRLLRRKPRPKTPDPAHPEAAALFKDAERLRNEFVVKVTGEVRERPVFETAIGHEFRPSAEGIARSRGRCRSQSK